MRLFTIFIMTNLVYYQLFNALIKIDIYKTKHNVFSKCIHSMNTTDSNCKSIENYLFLGYQDDLATFFFMHVINNSKYVATIDDNIYNTMIHEEMITDYEQSAIIYTFNLQTAECVITHITHKNNPVHTFDNPIDELKDELMNMYDILLSKKIESDDKHHLVISYDYEHNQYSTVEFRPKELPDGSTDASEFNVSEIRHVVCSKPALYLMSHMQHDE